MRLSAVWLKGDYFNLFFLLLYHFTVGRTPLVEQAAFLILHHVPRNTRTHTTHHAHMCLSHAPPHSTHQKTTPTRKSAPIINFTNCTIAYICSRASNSLVHHAQHTSHTRTHSQRARAHSHAHAHKLHQNSREKK